MVKMILTVPRGFNAEYFCNVVTKVVNDGRTDLDDDWKLDYDLGDFISGRISQTPYFSEYEMDADLVDFEIVDTICKLQELCPLVGFHFENNGGSEPNPGPYDKDYFYEACRELFYASRVKRV